MSQKAVDEVYMYFQMAMSQKAVEAMQKTHGTNYLYGSPAALLCKYYQEMISNCCSIQAVYTVSFFRTILSVIFNEDKCCGYNAWTHMFTEFACII